MSSKQIEGKPEYSTTSEASINEGKDALGFARRVFVATSVVASVAFVLYFVWYSADLLLLVFAGVLISILLRGLSRFVAERTGIGRGLSLALIMLAFVALIAAGVWSIPGPIGPEISELRQNLPLAVENVKEYAKQYEWVRRIIESLPNLNDYLAQRSGVIV